MIARVAEQHHAKPTIGEIPITADTFGCDHDALAIEPRGVLDQSVLAALEAERFLETLGE